jgi:hypothetical protein
LFLNRQCEESGEPSEADEFLGFLDVTTDGNGWVETLFNSPQAIPAGQAVAATATDADNNTSELSPCPESLVFKVENNGDVYADGTYQTAAADFAEMWPAATTPPLGPPQLWRGGRRESLGAGDVFALGQDGGVTLAGLPGAGPVIGVYSAQPGLLAGGPHASPLRVTHHASRVPVALVGIVPVKVSAENGPIHPGDLLALSSTPGVAARAEPVSFGDWRFYLSGSFFGKALEPFDGPATGVIRVLLIGQ